MPWVKMWCTSHCSLCQGCKGFSKELQSSLNGSLLAHRLVTTELTAIQHLTGLYCPMLHACRANTRSLSCPACSLPSPIPFPPRLAPLHWAARTPPTPRPLSAQYLPAPTLWSRKGPCSSTQAWCAMIRCAGNMQDGPWRIALVFVNSHAVPVSASVVHSLPSCVLFHAMMCCSLSGQLRTGCITAVLCTLSECFGVNVGHVRNLFYKFSSTGVQEGVHTECPHSSCVFVYFKKSVECSLPVLCACNGAVSSVMCCLVLFAYCEPWICGRTDKGVQEGVHYCHSSQNVGCVLHALGVSWKPPTSCPRPTAFNQQNQGV